MMNKIRVTYFYVKSLLRKYIVRFIGQKGGYMLIRCSECGRQISDSAEVCPGCGTRMIENCPNCGSMSFKKYGDNKVCDKCGYKDNGYTLSYWIKLIIFGSIAIYVTIKLVNYLMPMVGSL